MKLKLKDYKLAFFTVLFCSMLSAQQQISGKITTEDNVPLEGVQIYGSSGKELALTSSNGKFQFLTVKNKLRLMFYLPEYQLLEKNVLVTKNTTLNIVLKPFSEQLSEVEIIAQKRKVFELQRLKDVEETAIYAGKKTEVVLVSQSMANLASNNARQIYNQVAGLNIFQNDDAGLQLNIGGRGLDPNRTANFNTRQNGYDISADVLGYPESYYTPPAEALEEIQVIRGAASLQYGTQFGGLVNFVMKKPNANKEFEFLTRNTLGSNGLFTNFTSIGGTKNKLSYYVYYNYKQGDGFRSNSEFNSKNAFAHIGYQLNEKTKLEAEFTYLTYLAQQAGGLTDIMFTKNPFQSNRARNWFEIDWFLYNIKFAHRFTENTNFTFNFFGLDATRKALGFRTNRVNQVENGTERRDLISGDFKNFGFEARLLSNYKLFNKKSTFLVGTKFYKADNTSLQGPGADGNGANFSSSLEQNPNYPFQSNYKNPNFNLALFGENVLYLNNKWSITPGFRLEHIKTESDGYVQRINLDGAGSVILNERLFSDESNKRTFVLLGLGASFKPNKSSEFYANISQNYRSVTFSDLNVVNPSFKIDPNISDEKGFTLDIGMRGNLNKIVSYDAGAFALFYNDRIGFVQKATANFNVVQERTNIGNARIVGLETLFDVSLKKVFKLDNRYSLNVFLNTSLISSEYTSSDKPGVAGKKVEFVPDLNLKTGLKFGYDNFLASLQYTYLNEQFTDATNSTQANLSGVIGKIPTYDVLDFSASYKYKMFKLETGINNLLDNYYFTRRATGYPGPGIIPSAPRNWYVTLQFKL